MPFQTHNPRLSDQWTPERVAILLRLDGENQLSRAGIARELHTLTGSKFSRNAIIGKLGRLGTPPKCRPQKAPKTYRMTTFRVRGPSTSKPIIKPKPIAQESFSLSMMDLTPTSCRYPTTDSPIAFCGHPIFRRSYCEAHFELCYTYPGRPRPDLVALQRRKNQRLFLNNLFRCEAA